MKLRKLGSEKGCTFAPDLNLTECCALHDAAYTKGGSEQDRNIADRNFRLCIQTKFPNKYAKPLWFLISWVYYLGVRLGRRIGFRKSFNYSL